MNDKFKELEVTSYSNFEKHIPSTINPDTLFKFLSKIDYLKEILINKKISPRYFSEDLSYLRVKSLKNAIYPMICFCDINLHRLKEHVDFYGPYGIAFTKTWGMKHKIQPVQYMNPDSFVCKYFRNAFKKMLEYKTQNIKFNESLADYIYLQLMYMKPYSGKMRNNHDRLVKKCFTDECEWRYVPDVSNHGYKQFILNDDSSSYSNNLSNSLKKYDDIALKFDYSDIKYIIISNKDDLIGFIDLIKQISISEKEKMLLVSKIIIWEDQKGDF